MIGTSECFGRGARNHRSRDMYGLAGDAGTSRVSGATLDTRLSYRDGCSIMSTCSTCRPLQLNRSPDYPMTHNAHPALLHYVHAERAHTRPTSHVDPTHAVASVPPLAQLLPARTLSPGADRAAGVQVCSSADYCDPPSNSGHVKAIPGILLIVMQSRPAANANRTGS